MTHWAKRMTRVAGATALAAGLAACASGPAWGPAPNTGPQVWRHQGAAPQLERPASPLQCVPFARAVSGIQIFGDANTWWVQAEGRYPRSGRPAEGAVLALRGYADASRGHVAVVRAIVSDREILVDHANWLNQGEVTRNVPVIDVSPANDWSEVRVYWLPTHSMGVRTYQAQGFIHPAPLLFAGA